MLRACNPSLVGVARRLAKGKTVQEILDKVHKQALLRTGEKLDALKSWAWQFGIRVALFMFKVSPSVWPSATACQQPSALLVLPACIAATIQLARAQGLAADLHKSTVMLPIAY